MRDSDEGRPQPSEHTRESTVPARQTRGMSTGDLTAILDALPLDLTFVEKDGTIRYYNCNRHKVYPRDAELIGRRVQDCHAMTHAARQKVDHVLRVLASGESAEVVTVRREAERVLHVCYIAVRGDDGSCIGILQVTQDVTHIVESTAPDTAWSDSQGSGVGTAANGSDMMLNGNVSGSSLRESRPASEKDDRK